MARLKAQVSQLRSENNSLLNTYSAQSADKQDLSNTVHLMIDQLKGQVSHQVPQNLGFHSLTS